MLKFFTVVVPPVIGLIIYARWYLGVLEATWISVVKPAFIFGSDPNIHKIWKWQRNMGLGRHPHPLKIKDFDHFYDWRINDFGLPLVNVMLEV